MTELKDIEETILSSTEQYPFGFKPTLELTKKDLSFKNIDTSAEITLKDGQISKFVYSVVLMLPFLLLIQSTDALILLSFYAIVAIIIFYRIWFGKPYNNSVTLNSHFIVLDTKESQNKIEWSNIMATYIKSVDSGRHDKKFLVIVKKDKSYIEHELPESIALSIYKFSNFIEVFKEKYSS